MGHRPDNVVAQRDRVRLRPRARRQRADVADAACLGKHVPAYRTRGISGRFYFEYGQSLPTGRNAAANEITFGPAIAKDIGRTVHTLDLFLTRQLGPDQTNHGLDFSYEWQSRWNIWAPLSPAIEIYGDAGVLGNWPKLPRQQLLIGPVGIGLLRLDELGLGHAGNLKYEIGWLFGATQSTASGVLRWRLEVEIPF